MTEVLTTAPTETANVDGDRRRASGARAVLRRIAAVPRILTWCGLVVTAAGFVLIAIAWGEIAARTAVALQLPYLMSAGIVGLGLVLVGMTLVAIDAKLADARARAAQASELATRLAALLERGTRP
ncbi:MAG TPA: hypothetical protein VHE83_03625 [Mycobacteriales bacterium]|nr:hypothetical protein [Mycobacteriales bacterium]